MIKFALSIFSVGIKLLFPIFSKVVAFCDILGKFNNISFVHHLLTSLAIQNIHALFYFIIISGYFKDTFVIYDYPFSLNVFYLF
jgi:hypothetical protein